MTEIEMKRRKAAARKARQRKARNRRVLTTAILMLVVCAVSIGGTIAWLTDSTEEVKNVFTPSNINIELDESEGLDLKMVPGDVIVKDPKVTVKAGSEDCWVFVEIEESANLDDFIDYQVNPNTWKALKGSDNVWFCYAMNITADRDISIIGYNDENRDFIKDAVLVKDTVTKDMMDVLEGDSTSAQPEQPTLTFTAYAVQYSSFEPADNSDEAVQTAAQRAWAQAKPVSSGDEG